MTRLGLSDEDLSGMAGFDDDSDEEQKNIKQAIQKLATNNEYMSEARVALILRNRKVRDFIIT